MDSGTPGRRPPCSELRAARGRVWAGSAEAWNRRLEGWGLEMARSGRGQLDYWGLARRADHWLCRRRLLVFPLSQPQSQAVAALSARKDELPLPTPSPSVAEPAWVSAAAWGRGHACPAWVGARSPLRPSCLFAQQAP